VLKELDHEHGGKGFIDLIYIDPPFNSKRNYNVLFESIDLKDATAQKQAFADTWSNYAYIDTLNEIGNLDKDLHEFLTTLHHIRISDSAVAYITTMAIRIHYMHKLLKDTGNFYLHCDPTMSSYLRLICDLIFGEKNFRNEVIWKRTSGHNDSVGYGNIHDVIFYYNKSNKPLWVEQFQPYNEDYVKTYYRYKDIDGRRWMSDNLSAKGLSGGGYEYEWRGINGLWRCPISTMKKLDDEGRIYYTKNGIPRRKRYLDEMRGIPCQDIWMDIEALRSWHEERLEYPTQKPVALLERIIKASSNEGDIVADFFCGCGTTIAAAEKLNRKWIGSDISHLAIRLIVKRLVDTYGLGIKHNIEIKGFPKDVGSAKELSLGKGGRMEFQEWVIEALLGGIVNPKRTADGGWDGYMTFEMPDKKEFVLIEVKSGGLTLNNFRGFVQTIDREKAAIGIMVCFEEQVTKEMRKIAKEAGYYRKEMFDDRYPRIQIMTIEELLNNQTPKMPESKKTTFKSAQRNKEGKGTVGMFD
jgi:site-specific DNA-methyltransferase (adenine-specific)